MHICSFCGGGVWGFVVVGFLVGVGISFAFEGLRVWGCLNLSSTCSSRLCFSAPKVLAIGSRGAELQKYGACEFH